MESFTALPTAAEARLKLDRFVETICVWLTDDLSRPRKQRHTEVRVWERLRDEHQDPGARRATSVYIKQFRRKLLPREIFVPIDQLTHSLPHPPVRLALPFVRDGCPARTHRCPNSESDPQLTSQYCNAT